MFEIRSHFQRFLLLTLVISSLLLISNRQLIFSRSHALLTSVPESITYYICASNGLTEFWPSGNITTEVSGSITFSYTGTFTEWSGEEPFFNVTFRYANSQINATIANISQSLITMNLILGFGGFSPGICANPNWEELDQLAITVANSAPSAGWPGLNGTLEILSHSGLKCYNFTQNPFNGTQSTYLEYNASTGVLNRFQTNFGSFFLHASIDATDCNIPSTFPPSLNIFAYSFPEIMVGIFISMIGVLRSFTRRRDPNG